LYSGYAALTIVLVMAIVFGIYKVSGNGPETIDVNKPQNEKVGSIILKKPTGPIVDASQTAKTKTESVLPKTSVKMTASKSQVQKTQYPPGTPAAVEATDRSASENTKGTIIVAVGTANMRSKPSIDADKVAWASKGSSLKILDESQDQSGRVWYKVKLADGRECWISKRVVK
jgi:hypothetical protein